MRPRKAQRQCEGCRQDAGARFRALLNLYLCADCYAAWTATGQVPEPEIGDEGEERRW